MDKKIYIDRVDVSGCEFCCENPLHEIKHSCNVRGYEKDNGLHIHLKCKNNPDCYFKQLKRLKQENEELKQENKQLKKSIDRIMQNKEIKTIDLDIAKETGATITLTEDAMAGTKDVDVVYTDVWVSMGEPEEVWEERIKVLSPYKVTKEIMQNAGEQAIFLHCLPAFHDLKTAVGKEQGEKYGFTELEVTDEVFESAQSKVFDEAENRMHTIKAVMAATLGA